jgi:hypothetical protein
VSGNQLTIAGGNTVTLPDNDAQALSLSGNVISLTNGGSVTLPTTAAPAAPTLSISGQNLTISGGNTVVLPAGAATVFATPAETVAGTSTTLAVNPADLVARENIPAQTGLSLNTATIPAPTANQSPWGRNTANETLHYAPGLGWKIVDNYISIDQNVPSSAPVACPAGAVTNVTSYVAPRAGLVVVTANTTNNSGTYITMSGGISVNGALKRFDNDAHNGPAFTASGGGFYLTDGNNASTAWTGRVAAGDTLANWAICVEAAGTAYGNLTVTYIGQ